jgi:hypothetical protein
MKKTISLEKKIKSYSAIATGILAISATAQGQIIYHDVNPDVTLTGNDSLVLDLNNDSIIDFTLQHIHYVSGTSIGEADVLKPNGKNKVLSSGSYLRVLNNNDRISKNDTVWGDAGLFLAKWSYQGNSYKYGHWTGGVTDKYAGFKFLKSGNWYYGWARFDVDSNALSFKIKDWAYNSKANTEIKAGEKASTIIENSDKNEYSVFLNKRTLIIKQQNNNSDFAQINIYNASGQEIKKANLSSNRTEIDLSNADPGLYIVRINSEKGSYSDKIILQ